MATKIVTKNSSTASAVPTASDLVQGELAVNVADKRLFTEDNAGAIVELGTNPSGNVTFQDNGKAIFGAGSDLQIYHDTVNSIIKDAGTGNLELLGNNLRLKNADASNSYLNGDNGGAVTIYHAGVQKLATTSTGIDVTGTATMDGLTVSSGATFDGGDTTIDFSLGTGRFTTPSSFVFTVDDDNSSTSQAVYFRADSGKEIATFNESGDISFYEDTGTTPKFFWDASAESLGIGTSSPAEELDISADAPSMQLSSTNASGRNYGLQSTNNGKFAFYDGTAGVNRMVISSDGSVGIGCTPDAWSGYSALQIGTAGCLAASEDTTFVGANAYSSASGWKYVTTDEASLYQQQSGQHIWYNAASGSADAAVSWSERMRIDSSGNVGIGTTSPTNALDINGSQVLLANGALKFADAGNAHVGMIKNSGSSGTGQLEFYTGSAPTERMRIDSSGRLLVGLTGASGFGTVETDTFTTTGQCILARTGGNLLVGTTTQSGKVTINNGGSTGGLSIIQTSTSINYVPLLIHDDRVAGGSTAPNIVFQAADSADVGSIDSNISGTAYNTTSDQRLKDNIVDAPSASDDIDAIRVRSFDWKVDGSHQKYGMVAQELNTVAPEAVTIPDDTEKMAGVDYSKLVPMMLKEIQSLRNRVAQLEE